MLSIFLATAAWLPPLWGLGSLLTRVLRVRDAGLAVTGLMGLVVLGGAGTIVHLFAPLSPAVAGGAFLLGTALFVANARRLVAATPALTWAGMALVLAGVAVASDLPGRHYDQGVYWFQAVRWAAEAPQQLGIALLHIRFGFNSVWFTVSALLEHPLAEGEGGFVATALVSVLGAWLAAEGVRDVATGRRSFAAWLAISSALVVAACADQLGGASADAASAIVGYACLVSWARALEREEAFGEHARVAIVLAAFALMLKVSSGMWLAASAALLLTRPRVALREVRPALGAAAALLIPWVLTGYLASGCPLYPSSVGCLPLPWAPPEAAGVEVSRAIRGWARDPRVLPDVALAGWGWVPGWAERTWLDGAVRALVWTAAVGVVGLVALVRRRTSAGFRPLLAAAAAGVAFWFLAAPTPRFGWAYLGALAFVPAAEAAARLCASGARLAAVGVGAGAVIAAVALTSASVGWLASVPWEALSPVEYPSFPRVPYRPVETAGGLRVWEPVRDDQCWATPLPCMRDVNPALTRDGRVFGLAERAR